MPKLLTGLLDLDVDWSKWDVFFADERCVPLDDADSNYKACEDHLFSKIKGEKPTIHTLDTSLAPAQAAEKYGDGSMRWTALRPLSAGYGSRRAHRLGSRSMIYSGSRMEVWRAAS